MEISTGMMLPRWLSVAALYCLQKSMMLTPCGPSAVPTGGAGVAWPACSWTLTIAAIFFLGGMHAFLSFPFALDPDSRTPRATPRPEREPGSWDPDPPRVWGS